MCFPLHPLLLLVPQQRMSISLLSCNIWHQLAFPPSGCSQPSREAAGKIVTLLSGTETKAQRGPSICLSSRS